MKNILVLGGTGFVGRHVCEKLVRLGWRVTVPTRRRVNARGIQTLPGLDVIEADVHDLATLTALLPGHDAVVNLIAILHGNEAAFTRAHVTLAHTLAQAAQDSGVKRVVHLSALGVSEQGPSRYQISKARGEAVLRAAPLALTVLRPSVIFGAEDRFLNLFADMQSVLPLVPLGMAQARLQPVWVEDVASAVVRCLQDPRTAGQTFECAGPQVLTLGELVRMAGRLSGHARPVWELPVALAYFQALFMQCLPGEPLLSTDNLRALEVDNVASGALPGLDALGIAPAAVEGVAAAYLGRRGPRSRLLGLRRTAGRF